jgi:hypothetical protein
MVIFELKNLRFFLLTVLLCGAFGCAGGKSYDYQPTAGEMKQGPGALTGEEGELTVYDAKKGGLFPDLRTPEAEKTATAEAKSGKAAAESAPGDEDFQEFQEFQQWKEEKQEFREYQEWKKSAKDSADFKEFQEYQKWKQAPKGSEDFEEFQQWKEWKSYQEWKKRKTE